MGGQRGVQLAIGILLLWLAGVLLFVAFMSGKTPSLTVGTAADGTPQGPRDARQLLGRLNATLWAARGQGGEGTSPTSVQGGAT
jgi:hypothetical protein